MSFIFRAKIHLAKNLPLVRPDILLELEVPTPSSVDMSDFTDHQLVARKVSLTPHSDSTSASNVLIFLLNRLLEAVLIAEGPIPSREYYLR